MANPWGDMPELVDQNAAFIPPPPGATHGGQSGIYDPFPGAQSTPHNWPPPPPGGTPYHPPNQLPAWLQSNNVVNSPAPVSAQSWTYGQYSPFSPPSGWGPSTPAATWGAPTPNGSYGPHTPASAHSPYSPFIQNQPPGYFPAAAQDSPFGAPLNAGWYGGNTRQKQGQHVHTMQRTSSQNAAANRVNGLRRASSFGPGDYQMNPYPGYSQNETYDERNLARRPRDWRADYTPHSGISAYISRVGKSRSDVKEYTDPIKRTLHPLLLFSAQSPPIYLDLRNNPLQSDALEFLNLQRHYNDIDFAQLATQPSASNLRLYHPRLPWYIDIHQSHPNGVTVFDVLTQMWRQLLSQISGRHYWNEELNDVDRAAIASAFHDRCRGDSGQISRGVLQVDFLGRKVVFEGLARGKNGMWEIKTKKLE